MDTYAPNGLIQSLRDGFSDWTWTTLAVLVISTFAATRIVTGLQSRPVQSESGEPQAVRLVPYWFPWIGHGFSLAWDYLSYVEKTRFEIFHVRGLL
jgi:hypothetical protein